MGQELGTAEEIVGSGVTRHPDRMQEGVNPREVQVGEPGPRSRSHRNRWCDRHSRRLQGGCAPFSRRGPNSGGGGGGRPFQRVRESLRAKHHGANSQGCVDMLGAVLKVPAGPRRGTPSRQAWKAEVRAGELGGARSPGGPDLGLHVGGHALGGADDHVGDAVAQAGRAPGVPLPHPAGRPGRQARVRAGGPGGGGRAGSGGPSWLVRGYFWPPPPPPGPGAPLGQLHVGLLARVVGGCAGQLLGDDQLRDVNAITQQVGDDVLRMRHGARGVSAKGRPSVGLRVRARGGEGPCPAAGCQGAETGPEPAAVRPHTLSTAPPPKGWA